MPLFANTDDRSYIPGKPHPNCVEYVVSVGSDGFATSMTWRKDKRPKYGFPEAKIDQMKMYVDYFTSLHLGSKQPFIFFIDARWSSLPLLKLMHDAGFYCVLSCSITMRPQKLMRWMRDGLGVKDWWSVGLPAYNANLITIRTKKKVYLNILTNWGSLRPRRVCYRRRKPPAGAYTVTAPAVQKIYNKYKARVDFWNKEILLYSRRTRWNGPGLLYTQFFIHAFVLQSYRLYCASSGAAISQLEYRKRLIEALLPLCGLPQAIPLEQRIPMHWPSHMEGRTHRCQYPRCNNNCTYMCLLCDKWGCIKCLQKAHMK